MWVPGDVGTARVDYSREFYGWNEQNPENQLVLMNMDNILLYWPPFS